MQDGRFVPGAGATETELALQIAQYGDSLPGLEQYSVKKFATALESFVKTLAENTGVKAKEVISKLYALHNEGKKNFGFDIEVCSTSTSFEVDEKSLVLIDKFLG